jgi:hypothetical protein
MAKMKKTRHHLKQTLSYVLQACHAMPHARMGQWPTAATPVCYAVAADAVRH